MENTNLSSGDSTLKSSQQKKPSTKRTTILKKVDAETAKAIFLIKEKINKKGHGRRVRDSEVIAAGVKLIGADQIREMQETTYSEQDRLHLAHESFMKIHGKVSLDEFIGKLMRGEVIQKKEIA